MPSFDCGRLKHSYIFLYPIIYMICFFLLEKYIEPVHIIELPIDRSLPFCEYFIIPYILWFFYVAITVLTFFLFLDIGDFYRLCMHLFLGMTVFLIISAIYPNGQALRPDSFPRENVFTKMVETLYLSDTPTNILPSIHVYNSICVHIGIMKNQLLNQNPWLVWCSGILMFLIILSTVFTKQHSIVDVLAGILMAALFYPLFYKKNYIPFRSRYPLANQNSIS